jgi:hypothetical protein
MPEPRRILALERADELGVARLVDRADDHAPHAACGAGDDDS